MNDFDVDKAEALAGQMFDSAGEVDADAKTVMAATGAIFVAAAITAKQNPLEVFLRILSAAMETA